MDIPTLIIFFLLQSCLMSSQFLKMFSEAKRYKITDKPFVVEFEQNPFRLQMHQASVHFCAIVVVSVANSTELLKWSQ